MDYTTELLSTFRLLMNQAQYFYGLFLLLIHYTTLHSPPFVICDSYVESLATTLPTLTHIHSIEHGYIFHSLFSFRLIKDCLFTQVFDSMVFGSWNLQSKPIDGFLRKTIVYLLLFSDVYVFLCCCYKTINYTFIGNH